MTNTQYFVKLGYGDMFDLNTRSLDFKTERLLVDEACEVVQLVKDYNFFNGKKVAEVIKKIAELWPSDHQQVTFSFGRESSPVLYINFPYWKSQAERFGTREELIKRSMDLLKVCDPDELYEIVKGYGVRAWWD
jgi:hypothetical protein